MGGYIPKVLLDRAKSPQKRVGECGEMYEVTLRDTGLHQDLVNVFDATILERSIEGLISHSAIGLQESDREVYFCRDKSAQTLFEQSKDYWIHQAFTLLCYVFPRNPIIEAS